MKFEAEEGLRSLRSASLDWGLLICRIGIGGVLFYSCLYKWHRPFEFLTETFQYDLLGPKMGLVFAAILPAMELTLGVCLIGGLFLEGALAGSVFLFGLFVGAQGIALWRGLEISCGCFSSGPGESLVSGLTLLRTAIFMIIAGSLLARLISLRKRPSPLRMGI